MVLSSNTKPADAFFYLTATRKSKALIESALSLAIVEKFNRGQLELTLYNRRNHLSRWCRRFVGSPICRGNWAEKRRDQLLHSKNSCNILAQMLSTNKPLNMSSAAGLASAKFSIKKSGLLVRMAKFARLLPIVVRHPLRCRLLKQSHYSLTASLTEQHKKRKTIKKHLLVVPGLWCLHDS